MITAVFVYLEATLRRYRNSSTIWARQCRWSLDQRCLGAPWRWLLCHEKPRERVWTRVVENKQYCFSGDVIESDSISCAVIVHTCSSIAGQRAAFERDAVVVNIAGRLHTHDHVAAAS